MVSLTDMQRFFRGTILLGEPLASYTALGVGGPADYFLEVCSKAELADLIGYFHKNNFPHLILRQNMIVHDEGFRGAIILDKTKEMLPVTGTRRTAMFKSPTDANAGDLISQAGLNGLSIGGAKVAGNLLVNFERASARDIYELVHQVQHIIYEQWGVQLATELQFIGFEQPTLVNVS